MVIVVDFNFICGIEFFHSAVWRHPDVVSIKGPLGEGQRDLANGDFDRGRFELGYTALTQPVRGNPLLQPCCNEARGEPRRAVNYLISLAYYFDDQISLTPFREACPSRPTMMWSWAATTNDLAIAMMSKVILMSCVDGVGSPDGWL
jgi:hypothetical protein